MPRGVESLSAFKENILDWIDEAFSGVEGMRCPYCKESLITMDLDYLDVHLALCKRRFKGVRE